MGGVASDSLSHPQTSQTARNWLPRETVSPLVCGHGGIGCPGDLCSGSEGLRVLEPVKFETFESLHRGFMGRGHSALRMRSRHRAMSWLPFAPGISRDIMGWGCGA